MEFKFNVGDKVRILDDTTIPDYTGGFCTDMRKCIDEVREIVKREEHFGFLGYRLKGSDYLWDERGLKLVEGKTKFKIGDRVRCVSGGRWDKDLKGKVGVVKNVLNYDCYSVEFEHFNDGHDCGGKCTNKSGWNCNGDMLELMTPETILIYRKGDEVIALDKSTGEKAIARCNPKDTFDFKAGACLAFERLLGIEGEPFEPVKTPLNTKIVFTKGDSFFKTGHIYEIKNGKLERPNLPGMSLPDFPGYDKFYSIEDVKDYFTSHDKRSLHDRLGWSFEDLEFIEVKED